MGEISKFPKSRTLEIQNLILAVCLQNIKKLNSQTPFRKAETKSEKLLLSADFSILRLTFFGKSRVSTEIQKHNSMIFHDQLVISMTL